MAGRIAKIEEIKLLFTDNFHPEWNIDSQNTTRPNKTTAAPLTESNDAAIDKMDIHFKTDIKSLVLFMAALLISISILDEDATFLYNRIHVQEKKMIVPATNIH